MKSLKPILIAALILMLLCLAGCSGGESTAPEPTPEATAEPAPEPTPEPTPEPPSEYTVLGTVYPASADTVDLIGVNPDKFAEAAETLNQMPALKTVLLGDENTNPLGWDELRVLHEACPQLALDYGFTLYNMPFRKQNLSSDTLDVHHITLTDDGELVCEIASLMTNLKLLDMDSCCIDNERMAEIRDSMPGVDVVWRISFGEKYSVRTNVERILASMPGKAGELTSENVGDLKYCTKVKYIDMGHNNYLDTIEFCRYMPDLEVAIFGMTFVDDFSPLENCPKLEYLEAMTSRLYDLTPFANLTNLRHLNICYNFAVRDISPLYNLTDLERLWIGCYDPIPPEQIKEMQKRAPGCEINVTTGDPTADGWRFILGNDLDNEHPRYRLLRRQFGYTESDYAFYWVDPMYRWQY